MNSWLKILLTIGVAATGCGDGVQPEQRELVYFTAIETDEIKPRPIPDPGVQLTQAQVSGSEKIVNGFLENHERLLREPEVAARIEQIENIFLALGRYHELMVIYRDDWEANGTKSHVADRFAWGLVRLGQRKQSREVIDKLLADHPGDARVHFLDGAAYLQEQPPNPKYFAAIVAAWTRVIELDPGYVGYEGISAQMLQGEIAKFAASIPPDAAPPAEVPTLEPPAEPAVDEPTTPEPEPEQPAKPEVVEVPTEPVPVAAAEPAVPSPPDTESIYRLAIAKGQIALAQGKYTAAEDSFLQARALKPNDFDAEFGHLSAGWGNEAARNRVSEGMRGLAERTDLSPPQRLDLGVFLWTKLGRKDLARKQFDLAKAADASLAPKIDGLIQQMK